MAGKAKALKPGDREIVLEFMRSLVHPLKKEIEEVRAIISGADSRISERIKWNAPSYYFKEDIVTFNPRNQERVHLVFHHKDIVKIKSDLLQGDYKDRRMMYFSGMEEVDANRSELTRIMKEHIQMLEG